MNRGSAGVPGGGRTSAGPGRVTMVLRLMLLAFFLAAALAGWVPARWFSTEPASLELLAGTPINCLLLEEPQWDGAFLKEAAAKGVACAGVLRPGEGVAERARLAAGKKLSALVLEGEFTAGDLAAARATGLPVVELRSRRNLDFDSSAPVTGTYQGVWPGIRPPKEHGAAAPTGSPWIDTNTGFLRFTLPATGAAFWIANRPPEATVITGLRYLQAIADAAAVGARWVLALDADFAKRLLAGDAAARRDWKRIGAQMQFYEDHKEWRAMPPYSELVLLQDIDSGALLSGGVVDMLATANTPVRPVRGTRVKEKMLEGARTAVNIDPAALGPEQKEAVAGFTRRGGTVVNGPPGWKMPAGSKDGLTLDREHIEKVEAIWPELRSLTNRKNLGARLFNVSGMLSYLQAAPDGKKVVLHLVNYTDYPVENVTAFFLGKFTRATLYAAGAPPRQLSTYPTDDGTGVDIDRVEVSAALALE